MGPHASSWRRRSILPLLALILIGWPHSVAGAHADDGRTEVRWWEDSAVAPPPAENVARLAVLCEVSDDQLARWIVAIDAHRAAIDALISAAEASGPVVFRLDDDASTRVRAQIGIAERLSRLRRSVEPLRDQLFAALLDPLTEDQRALAIGWRNLVLFDVNLMQGMRRFSSIGSVALEETLSEMRLDRTAAARIGTVLSATADSRRGMGDELSVRDGGVWTGLLRKTVVLMDAGATREDAASDAWRDPPAEVRRSLQSLERYRSMVLGVVDDLGGLGLPRAIVDEGRARILALTDPNLVSPGSTIVAAARLLGSELSAEDRTELERLNDAAIQAMVEHARTAPSPLERQENEAAADVEAAFAARLAAVRAPVQPLASCVRRLGGTFESMTSLRKAVVMRRPETPERGALAGEGGGAMTAVVAGTLASDLGWEPADVPARTREVAAGRPVREVGTVVNTERAARAADLLDAVARADRLLVAEQEAWVAAGDRMGPTPPRDLWGNAPLTAWVLETMRADERTPERLERLLEFERARLIRLEATAAAPAPGPVDWQDRAAIAARYTAVTEEAGARGALVTAALESVTDGAPRLREAVFDVIDGRRIGWMLTRHRAMEALLADVESDLRLDPTRRLRMIDAGVALRAVARRVDLWVGRVSDVGGPSPAGLIVIEYRTAQRIWARHAFVAELIERRRQLLDR
jgi:hypothetical protein